MTSTTRRAALTALAGVPALAIPAVAVAEPVDPIFAAIERHKAAWKVVMDAMDVRDTDPQPYEEADEIYTQVLGSGDCDRSAYARWSQSGNCIFCRMGPRCAARRQRTLPGNSASVAGVCSLMRPSERRERRLSGRPFLSIGSHPD